MPTVGGSYLYRSLQQALPGVLKKRYRKLMFEDGSVVPTMPDLQVGARELIRDRISEYGEAAILGADAGDIPVVEVSVDEDSYRVVMIVGSFSFSFSDEMAAQQATRNGVSYNVRTARMEAASRVIAEKVNAFAAFGDSKLSITGFVNNANVTLNNSSFDPYASTTTADDLADFILEEMESIATSTNNVEFPTDLLVPVAFYYKLTRTRIPDTSMNVLQYIMNVQGDRSVAAIQRIRALPELASATLEANGVQATSTNKDRFILYPLDDSVVSRHNKPTGMVPEDYVHRKGLIINYPMYQLTSQTMIEFPGALRYTDVTKAA